MYMNGLYTYDKHHIPLHFAVPIHYNGLVSGC